MPGMYQKGEFDVAGKIVGVVDRSKMLDVSKVRIGDVLMASVERASTRTATRLRVKCFWKKPSFRSISPPLV